MVWADERSGTWAIWGRLVTMAGVPLGSDFRISSAADTKDAYEPAGKLSVSIKDLQEYLGNLTEQVRTENHLHTELIGGTTEEDGQGEPRIAHDSSPATTAPAAKEALKDKEEKSGNIRGQMYMVAQA